MTAAIVLLRWRRRPAMVPSAAPVLVVSVPMCVSSSSWCCVASLPTMSGGAGDASKESVGGVGGGAGAARPGKLLSTNRAWGDTYMRLFSGSRHMCPGWLRARP
eukprot:6064923-Pleurochrysis_carterae.AAC.1